ncbi:hypothetical protein GUITHDRAFT_99654 [Guillardia theta CCMP2712]|uniref:Uncharacterized protein n=1 Tax=Guillardia theta (strain CCMP2712) TaxID=905079 RepID=L1K329_GUITC|nr:hypothetical protein GUITHDRAFT_99654 [Guillardia theta CCMP2712]EKX55014.1 hypothetical protein GUITHDRAFT_99654 [Guillardia theta CCMP2712]|eukprot:XP_005841994.1 hypothetical protein GUITHDRAFT_99654 [Guillardia theta CCMP2712]
MDRISKIVDEGRYYEALQQYKSTYFRYKLRNNPATIDLLRSGAVKLLEHKQYEGGLELGSLLVEHLVSADPAASSDSLGAVKSIAEAFSECSGAEGHQVQYLTRAIKWSKGTRESKSVGDATLHQYIAEAYLKLNNLPLAHMHFACGNDPKRFATLLRAMSSECRGEEQDLVWARAILQSLCAKNLELAVGLLEESMKTGNNIEFRKIRL